MNPYPHGQCTWGAAEMCSCLQNLSQYGNFGNGGDWYAHAQSIGLTTDTAPHVGWLASFNVSGWPDGPGDVGLIVAIDPIGKTVTRYGTNWHLDGSWSTDVIQDHLVIGSFQPPCNCLGANATLFSSKGGPQSANCMTFDWHWSLAGQSIDLCFDGIVGMVATGGGILLMTAGAIVMILGMQNRKPKLIQAQPQQQESLPTAEQTQDLTPQERDAIIMRARQRAQARSLQYKRSRGYQERRVARLKTSAEVPTGGTVP